MINPSDSKGYSVFVIPHTHWDREWYATFQQFRIRLVHVLDDLLDLFEKNPSYSHFNLDAQTVVLQDYLDIRPEKRDIFKKLVSERRLGVGPWYVMPDEFLVSGEALVRNLLLGHRIASEFGHVQKVGYIPDTFGHISQLPQILQGFGIASAIHFRGLDEGDLKSELWWQSPDGTRVLLRHLPTDMGYNNAAALAEEIERAGKDLNIIARYETRRAASSVLLALNGGDHLPARRDLPAIIDAANQQADGRFLFRQASLEQYIDALVQSLGAQPLQTVYGELRDTNRTPGQDNRVLPHILSSRMYLKMQNERAQTLLERWAEPWSALAWLAKGDYPAAFLWKSWEWLLQNHPHDSIGGCSVDAVHAQMETRFSWASEIAEEITCESLDFLASQIDLSGLHEDEAALVIFNGLPWPLEGAITVDVDLWNFFLDQVAMNHWKPPANEPVEGLIAPDLFRLRIRQQWYGDKPVLPSQIWRGLRIRPIEGGDPLQVQVESISRSHVLRPQVGGLSSERSATCFQASFTSSIPAYGYRVFGVSPTLNPNKPVTISHSHNILENEFLRVKINSNGTLEVEDKVAGQVFHDLGYFEDGGDCGDGYNYSYPPEDRVENTLGQSPHISRLSEGPAFQRYRIDYEWALPASLDTLRRKREERRIICSISVTVSLAQKSPRLDLKVTIDNRALDHRLRIIFPSDIKTNFSQASAQFDVVSHSIHVAPVLESAWNEDAPRTFPQQDWVDLSDGQRGLCIISRGLPEYEIQDTERREVAVTLLRAVGYLGAGFDLQTAFVGAGPNIATPEAQIQRKLSFSLAILPHIGTWDEVEVWRESLAFNNPPRAVTTAMDKMQRMQWHGNGSSIRSLLRVEGKNAILSSLKKAEEDEALILRLYNPSDFPTQATIQLPFTPRDVQWVGLDEQPILSTAANIQFEFESEGKLRFSLPPRKILTFKVMS